MGVDGIDKADIFDEYFDDDKLKLTNYEKIKAMSISQLAEFLYNKTCICNLEPCSECINQDWCDCSSIEDFEKWLKSAAN